MISKGNRIELREEGASLGFVRALNIAGSTVTATVSGDVGTITDAGGGGAGSDFVTLASYAPSGATSVDISSTYLTSTYSTYLIILQELGINTDDTEINVRTDNNSGGSVDSAASDYSYVMHTLNTTGPENVIAANAAQIALCNTGGTNGIGNGAGEGMLRGQIWLTRGSGLAYPSVQWSVVYVDSSTRQIHCLGSGFRKTGGPCDFLRIFPTAGTMTGFIYLYGMTVS